MSRFIDLTLSFQDGMRGYSWEQKYTTADKGWNARTLHIYSHAGTHVDAPNHYDVSKKSVDEIGLEQLITPAWICDVTHVGAGELIHPTDLGDIQEKIQPGQSLLLRTDWSKKIGTKEYREKLPRISTALAEWCAAQKIAMIGVEPPAVADPFNIPEIQQIHHILLAADIVIIEGLTNLDQISQQHFTLVTLPLKIANGDGAPCRVVAVVDA